MVLELGVFLRWAFIASYMPIWIRVTGAGSFLRKDIQLACSALIGLFCCEYISLGTL